MKTKYEKLYVRYFNWPLPVLQRKYLTNVKTFLFNVVRWVIASLFDKNILTPLYYFRLITIFWFNVGKCIDRTRLWAGVKTTYDFLSKPTTELFWFTFFNLCSLRIPFPFDAIRVSTKYLGPLNCMVRLVCS